MVTAHQMAFVDEHRRLLTAQVVLTDRMDQLTGRMDQLVGRMDQLVVSLDQLAQAQRHTDERMNALIGVVDGLINKGEKQ